MLTAEIYTTTVHPVHSDITVRDALAILVDKKYNGVIVLDEHEQLVGVLSLQDIAAAIVPIEMRENTALAQAMYKPEFFKEQCEAIASQPIADIMRRDFITVAPDTSVMTVAADFLLRDLYLVPVVDRGRVVGIITRSEIKKALARSMGISSTSNQL